MTAYTCSQTGNWSVSSTWGGVGVPASGDTATIGNFTVTVDANTTVGTSPNDTTTKVVDLTNAGSKLIIASGVTLTVKGNRGAVNGSTFQQNAGSTLTFDNSGSGGSPVYRDINTGFTKYVFSGTANSGCIVQAISGQTFNLNANWNAFTATYTTFRRCASPGSTSAAGGATGTSITHCTYDTCGNVDITQASATLDFTYEDNVHSGSTHASDSAKFSLSTAATTSIRKINRNVFDKELNLLIKNIAQLDNNYCYGITCYTGTSTSFTRPPRNNFIDNTQNLNGGNGMVMAGSWDGLYCTSSISSGNPHFIAPTVTNGADETYRRVIFESQSPDLVDTGDCFLGTSTFCSSGLKLNIRNCIVLRNPSTGVTTGQLLTSFNPPASAATHKVDIQRCTANQNKSAVGGVGMRACVAFAEGATGAADQISVLKSNIAWATASSNGYLAERISGTVDGHITASGADYNWLDNIETDNNGRGYRDRANSPAQDLWAAGTADGSDAAGAGVDGHQGSGDPQFFDDSRCLATWCSSRGYGSSSYSDGVAAVKADPTRITDLINYIFEGFKPTNASCRTASHEGGCVGAANYHNTSRTLTKWTGRRTAIAAAYSASFA